MSKYFKEKNINTKNISIGLLLLFIATLPLFAANQTNPSTHQDYNKAVAAVEAAITKASNDPTRPVYHFRPPAQWMNDICGAIYYNGYYHIFYQYNPFSGDSWGANYTLWAHTQSKDLVHWEDLPWALLPMKNRGERRCNSGCVTLDGFNKPMLFYTFVPDRANATKMGKREQWASVPLDEGLIRWQRVKDKPLMAAGMNGVSANVNGGWSDPFVFRCDGQIFVTFKSCNGLVCRAKNKELTEWEYAGQMDGVDGECPNFFALQDKWVLLRSTAQPSYVVGDFNSKTIKFNVTGKPGVLDYGFGDNPPKDRAWTRGLYATNVFADPNGRQVMVGWICGFKPGRGWNGCMSLPRILSLDKDNRLIQTPATELKMLRGKHLKIESLNLNSESRSFDAKGDTLEIIAEFLYQNSATLGMKVRCSDDGQDAVTIKYADGILNVAGTKVPIKKAEGLQTIKLHIFLDKSVMEVFVNDGLMSISRVNYPNQKDLGVAAFCHDGGVILNSLDIWQMKSIWQQR